MKLSVGLVFVATCLFPFTGRELFPAPFERSVSPSRQFIVYGADARLRGAISDLAERTKAGTLALLRQRDQWKTPIVINLQFPQTNLPEIPDTALRFSQTGAGQKIQLDLVIGADVNAPAIERDLLRSILLEVIYRDQSEVAPGTVYVTPPGWLLDGLLAAVPGKGRRPLLEAITPLVASQKIISLHEFLRQKPEQLDSTARLLYRAYSLALVQLLLQENDGPSRLVRYVETLSRASNDPLSDLKAQFQTLGSGSEIEQIWKSSVTSLAAPQKYQLLSFAETQARLDELLRIKIPEGADSTKIYRLENFLTGKISAAQTQALTRLSRDLLLLTAAANPLLRPIVSDYQQVTQRLATGKRAGLADHVARLSATRTKLAVRMRAVDDYMNWFEATQSGAKSGLFVDYLRAAGAANEPESPRNDPLSVYLDAVEDQFQD
jgi:hypothetical protein